MPRRKTNEESELLTAICTMMDESGMTRKEIAQKIGTDPSTLAEFVKGKGTQLLRIEQIAKLLGYEFVLRKVK